MDEGVRVLTRPTFAPGQYQLRITASDSSTGLVGSAVHDFEVPGFVEPSPIAMSGLALTSSDTGGVTHAEVEDDHRLLPILAQPPSARREFSQAERLEVHAEFYERPLEFEFDQQIDVVTRVLAPDGRLVWDTRDIGQSEMLPRGHFGYAHSALVPIGTLAPGRYVLQVGAETQYGIPAFVSRSVAFTVIGAAAR